MTYFGIHPAHKLDPKHKVPIHAGNQTAWLPVLPYPAWTKQGLPLLKRFNKANRRAQCGCGRIFNTLEDYYAHVVFVNSPYREIT